MAILTRAWQMLLKGLEEIAQAPNQAAAAEMVLIRLALHRRSAGAGRHHQCAGRCPPARRRPARGGRQDRAATGGHGDGCSRASMPIASDDEPAGDEDSLLDDDVGPAEPVAVAMPIVRSFAEVVATAGERREAKLKVHLEEHVSLVRFDAAGSIELHLLPGAPKELANELREKLNAWTGKRWMVALSKTPGERTIGEAARREGRRRGERSSRSIPPWRRCCSSFPTPRSPACGRCRAGRRTTLELGEMVSREMVRSERSNLRGSSRSLAMKTLDPV